VDSVYSHQAFAKELGGLPFDLIGDFERKMVADYGVVRDDVVGYSGVARRTIFIIDREGVIRWTWVTSKEQRLPDYDMVMEEAKKIAAGTGSDD
jgi:peroxiredoxin